jgi:hypothetical protein
MDHLPHFVCPHVVQLRYPVVAVVDGLVAGGFVGLVGIHWTHGATEGVTSGYAVYVVGSDTWLDDGIGPLYGERRAVHGKGITTQARNERYAKDYD